MPLVSPPEPRAHTAPSCPQTQAEAFLEGVQERIYTSLGVSADAVQMRELVGQQQILPARLQHMRTQLPPVEFERYSVALFEGLARDERLPRPTRFERPHQYAILTDLKDAIERAASRLGLRMPLSPVLGTLPTHLLAPLMMRVPDTQDVVLLVDGQVLTYANQLSKVIAQVLPFGFEVDGDDGLVAPDPSTWSQEFHCGPYAIDRLTELVFASLDGQPGRAPSYHLDADTEPVAGELCDCMELFIVGREYARLVGGDHLSAPAREHVLHGQPLSALAWTIEQEAHADALGLALAMSAAAERGNAASWTFVAVDALLASFGTLERTARLLTASGPQALLQQTASVHLDRRMVLRRVLDQWPGGAQIVEFADALVPALCALEEGVEAAVCDLCWPCAAIN